MNIGSFVFRVLVVRRILIKPLILKGVVHQESSGRYTHLIR